MKKRGPRMRRNEKKKIKGKQRQQHSLVSFFLRKLNQKQLRNQRSKMKRILCPLR
jgi:hypothetical protein